MIQLLPLAIALTAAGMGANYIGAKKADNATADVLRAERTRQSALDDQAFAINDQARDRYADIAPQQDAKAADLAEMFTTAGDNAPAFGPAPSADSITVQQEAKAKEKSKAYTDKVGTARGQMLSLGDLFGDIGVEQAQDMSTLNAINSQKRGSQGVLPFELDAAGQKGQGWRLTGDILGGLGSVASMGAMTGATLPGMGGILNFGRAAQPAATAVEGSSRFMPLRSLW